MFDPNQYYPNQYYPSYPGLLKRDFYGLGQGIQNNIFSHQKTSNPRIPVSTGDVVQSTKQTTAVNKEILLDINVTAVLVISADSKFNPQKNTEITVTDIDILKIENSENARHLYRFEVRFVYQDEYYVQFAFVSLDKSFEGSNKRFELKFKLDPEHPDCYNLKDPNIFNIFHSNVNSQLAFNPPIQGEMIECDNHFLSWHMPNIEQEIANVI